MTDKILIVEDDPSQLLALSLVLERTLGYKTIKAENAAQAFALLNDSDVRLIILDLKLPEMDGMEMLEVLQRHHAHIPVIILTGENNVDTAVEAMRRGACDFLSKPPEPGRLKVSIQNALRISALEKEVSRLKKKEAGAMGFDDLVGANGGLAEVVKIGRKAAASDIPVLLTGETGVGKEVFARAIHGESRRSGHPFIAVNCGAIPENLVESILFGHEKGAFTGALSRAPGKFLEADGGTILLDEVGDLPFDAQVKILRVLQNKEINPVGSSKTIPINVRIISATNRDLDRDIAENRFRSDLFFRLNVLPVRLPSLRERAQDIPLLIQDFIERFAARENLPLKKISPEAVKLLAGWPWPGNVRELENTLHRAIVLSEGELISESDIKALKMTSVTPGTAPLSASDGKAGDLSFLFAGDRLKTISEIEQEAIRHSLKHYHDNITQAAQALDMAKSTFYRKLKEYSGEE